MSVPRYDTGATVLGNKIYVFGGNDNSGNPQSALEVYDPAADQWTPLPPMSVPRSRLVIGTVGNTIYAIGGSDTSGPLGTVEAFDGSSWTPRANMPTSRFASGAGVINNQIHVFGGATIPLGGATIPHEVSTDEVYDPTADTWSTAPSMPTARFGLGSAVANNHLYAIGGLLGGIATVDHLFVYQITATNQPTFYAASSADGTPLPDWLHIDHTSGILSGIPPTESHDNHIKLTAQNAGGIGSAFLTFSVQSVASSGLEIVSSTSATGKVGVSFGPNGAGFHVLAENATSSAKYSAGGLPPGLTINQDTGLIFGTPMSAGNFAVSLGVTDVDAPKANSILQLTIISDSTPIITSSDTAVLSPGQFFSRTLTADLPAAFSYIGTDGIEHAEASFAGLPPGLMFDGINKISGTYSPGTSAPNSNRIKTSPTTGHIRPNAITIRPPRLCQIVARRAAGAGAGTGTVNRLGATNSAGGTGTSPLNLFERPAPTINNVPVGITAEATGPNGAVVTFLSPSATDIDGNNVSVNCNPPSGSTFPLGKTTVTCTATDSAGASGVVTFDVTVVDTTPPVITVPPNITVAKAKKIPKKQPQGAQVSFSVSATDIVDGAVTATPDHASGSFFPLGVTTVTVNATDSHGNQAVTKTFTVSVVNKIKKRK
jgi:hypothetical protein